MEAQKSSGRVLCVVAIVVAAVSLGAGILIGHYAISKEPSGVECVTEPEPTDNPVPNWPFVAHLWNNYDDKHVAKTAWKAVTEDGMSRLEAVVAGLTDAEMDDNDPSVASGRSPDETGETTLDAMIMDGETHGVGAVGGLRGVKNAIGAAYAVMKYTTHSLLVGQMASDFAISMGVDKANLSIQAEIDTYNEWLGSSCQPNYRRNVLPTPTANCGPYTPDPSADEMGQLAPVDETHHDTIGMIVIDADGKIAAGTSTNGMRHKVKGRVGDSPVPGAGSYVDKDVGACTATGDGDIMVRFLPCMHAIEEVRNGKNASEAARAAVHRIQEYYQFNGALLVVNKDGTFGGYCSGFSFFEFVYQHEGMSEPEVYRMPQGCD